MKHVGLFHKIRNTLCFKSWGTVEHVTEAYRIENRGQYITKKKEKPEEQK